MKKAYRKIAKKVKKIEKTFGSLQDFALSSTNFADGHKMRMEENPSSYLQMHRVYQELDDLERADLEDFRRLSFYGDKF